MWWAALVRMFGVFAGSNLALLSAHLLAGASFYGVCRYLRYEPIFAYAGAVLFALSRYAFWRSLANLSLTFYWHLPLALLVLWWCVQDRPILRERKKVAFCIAVAVLHGVQSPYFSAMFLQLLFWASVYSLLRFGDWRRLRLPMILAGALAATLFVMNVDTIYSWMIDGPNPGAAPRWYYDLERYALKPVELLVPRSHSIEGLARWGNQAYFKRSMLLGEEGSSYCGAVGLAAGLLLVYATAKAVAKDGYARMPVHFYGICLVAMFSVVGGINGIAGLSGMLLFRASNRYSIFIFAILLLFLVRQLSSWSKSWRPATTWSIAALLLAVGVYDQVPPRYPGRELAARQAMLNETKLVSDMEARLPRGASVFQLPVYDFPEGPLIGSITDYEHFRPFLHSSHLKFSYGATKGRHEERWQKEVEQLGVEGGLKIVENYGFSALLIDRRGYADRAHSLQEALQANGRSRVLAATKDLVCIALNPVRHPSLPPVFGKGWSDLEGNYRHNQRGSSGDATLTLYNHGKVDKPARLEFALGSRQLQDVTISLQNQQIYETSVAPEALPRPVALPVVLKPGSNRIQFKTSDPHGSSSPSMTSPAFNILDFRLLE